MDSIKNKVVSAVADNLINKQLKQNYLRTQIVEPGYNQTDFGDFLGSKKENGV